MLSLVLGCKWASSWKVHYSMHMLCSIWIRPLKHCATFWSAGEIEGALAVYQCKGVSVLKICISFNWSCKLRHLAVQCCCRTSRRFFSFLICVFMEIDLAFCSPLFEFSNALHQAFWIWSYKFLTDFWIIDVRCIWWSLPTTAQFIDMV